MMEHVLERRCKVMQHEPEVGEDEDGIDHHLARENFPIKVFHQEEPVNLANSLIEAKA